VKVDKMLETARARLDRVGPERASELAARGALVVDTRPQWQRDAEGTLPGALVIERNHLEWRLDPTSDARIPEATDHDVTPFEIKTRDRHKDLREELAKRVVGKGWGIRRLDLRRESLEDLFTKVVLRQAEAAPAPAPTPPPAPEPAPTPAA